MLCAQQCWLLQFCWKQAKQRHSVLLYHSSYKYRQTIL
jgi:hypothetical protein